MEDEKKNKKKKKNSERKYNEKKTDKTTSARKHSASEITLKCQRTQWNKNVNENKNQNYNFPHQNTSYSSFHRAQAHSRIWVSVARADERMGEKKIIRLNSNI